VQAFNLYGFENFFYSRRIGRAPQRSLAGPMFAAVDGPDQTTILGAAKVSGRTPAGWTVGLMTAITAREQALVFDRQGERAFEPVEPLSNYFVGRLRRDLRQGQSVVGGILTSTHRELGDSALRPLLRGEASVAGLDFQHRWAAGRWALTGYAVGSSVAGSTEAITRTQLSASRYYARPDAEHLVFDAERTSLQGTMAHLALRRSGSWDMSVAYKQASPGFEINDAGFQGRVDYRSVSTYVGQRFPRPRGIFRDLSYAFLSNHGWNYDGDQFYDVYGASANGSFHNFWNIGLNLLHEREVLDDRLTRGGPLATSPAFWQGSANAGTDPRSSVRVVAAGTLGRWADGGGSSAIVSHLILRPTSYVEALLGPSVRHTNSRRQYVVAFADAAATPTFGRRIVFSDLDQTTLAADLRLNWTFTPDLSLQLFAQPYLSAGAYTGFKEFTAPGALEFAVYGRDRGTICRYPGSATIAVHPTVSVGCPAEIPSASQAGEQGFRMMGDPDFNFRSLRGNAVLRWEYRPGSTLFVVWQQDRSQNDHLSDVRWGRDAVDLLRSPGRNVFLIKATYWLAG
jgi:hypothetical protein